MLKPNYSDDGSDDDSGNDNDRFEYSMSITEMIMMMMMMMIPEHPLNELTTNPNDLHSIH